tara:strand:- start:6515 stop:7057 length:543 start_codon:yes stop_codon:yes gene_type:complete
MKKYSKYNNKLSFKNKIARFSWNFCYYLFFRPLNLPHFNFFRIFLLRIFGAKIGNGCKIQSTVRIWAPWNLIMGDLVAFGANVKCYNPGPIVIGSKVAISHGAHLCSASHDFTKKDNPLLTKKIVINDMCWIASEAFVGMGVTLGHGSIIGARSVIVKDVDSWSVVAGNPAKFIKKRTIN